MGDQMDQQQDMEQYGDNMDGQEEQVQEQMEGEPMEGEEQYDEMENTGDMEGYNQGGNDGQPIEYAELVKTEVLQLYRDMCDQAEQEANEAFCVYLEETFDENDALDIVI